jgi:hypothetical protein
VLSFIFYWYSVVINYVLNNIRGSIMCGGDRPDYEAPIIPPVQPEAADSSRQQSVEKDSDYERKRRMAAGQSGTILTGNRGLTNNSSSQGKTLLGN